MTSSLEELADSWLVKNPDDWRHDAACRDEDPELFFPVGSSSPALRQEIQAKAVCSGCLVRVECLSWALVAGERDGVWGGTSEDDRRKMRRASTPPPRPRTEVHPRWRHHWGSAGYSGRA
jgi:WhiB family redox-sensing transcriptional regulator